MLAPAIAQGAISPFEEGGSERSNNKSNATHNDTHQKYGPHSVGPPHSRCLDLIQGDLIWLVTDGGVDSVALDGCSWLRVKPIFSPSTVFTPLMLSLAGRISSGPIQTVLVQPESSISITGTKTAETAHLNIVTTSCVNMAKM